MNVLYILAAFTGCVRLRTAPAGAVWGLQRGQPRGDIPEALGSADDLLVMNSADSLEALGSADELVAMDPLDSLQDPGNEDNFVATFPWRHQTARTTSWS